MLFTDISVFKLGEVRCGREISGSSALNLGLDGDEMEERPIWDTFNETVQVFVVSGPLNRGRVLLITSTTWEDLEDYTQMHREERSSCHACCLVPGGKVPLQPMLVSIGVQCCTVRSSTV